MQGSEPSEPPVGAAVHSATIFCDTCGTETEHRILRIDPRGSGRPDRAIAGIARCRVCRSTHAFRSEPPDLWEVAEVVSEGRVSHRGIRRLPRSTRIEVGADVPETDPPRTIHGIDLLDGRRVRSARLEDVRTIWVTINRGAVVPVSIIEGRRTRSVRMECPADRLLEVGGPLELEGLELRIVAVRAQGRTWKVPGDKFQASQVVRAYARRTLSPPAGSMPWRRERGSPSSRASSISRSARSRSSPGVRTNRAPPGRTNASGGATVQSSSPS